MDFSFPVALEYLNFSREEVGNLSNARLSFPHLQVDESDFIMNIDHVASFRVRDGNHVSIHPHENADMASIKLFLNGPILGAVLHQQGILPFHGCSFEYDGKGILICGYSGSGKSSVTAAFCQNGGCFINDDVTPVRMNGPVTAIIPIKTKMKLWDDSLLKLKITNNNLEMIRPSINKFYLPIQESSSAELHLDHLFILCKHNKDTFEVNKISGMFKYNALRSQIYRRMYLKGMPETEKTYFKQLIKLAGNVRVTQIFRPASCDIYETMKCIKKEIDQ